MAEAVVEAPPLSRFFCHKCSVEITPLLPDFVCPNCYLGFIERLEEQPPEPEEPEFEMDDVVPLDRLEDRITDILMGVGRGGLERRVPRVRDRDGTDLRRPGPRFRARQLEPIEHLIQDFIVNLSGVGWGAFGGRQGNAAPVLFLGNPGDYAWGREGLDAIVTQLLNQMDGTGPPPLAKDKIKEIPVVMITEDQVSKSLQCSVCWEDFSLDEHVRKLPCEHVYHENCIIPWLELHGTCPICRKTLGDDGIEEQTIVAAPSPVSSMASSLAALIRAGNESMGSRNALGSSSSGTSTSSSSRSTHPSDFNMDLEFD